MKTVSKRRITLCLLLSLIVTTGLEAQNRSFVLSDDSTHNIGGSTVVIDQKRMNRGLMTNSLQALTGQAAGLNVQTSGANRMAMLNSVRLRGTTSLTGGNEPLVIIDGVYSNLSALSGIYPADIESFTILKNAAETAPYGSQGASGVIVVTTKKGQGAQFHISYDGNIGFEAAYKQLDMLDANEYVATARQLHKPYVDGGNDTDFQRALRRTGFAQNHHIAFSGGSDKQHYRASLAYMGENTVITNNSYRNFAAKLDVSQQAFDDILTIDLGVVGSSQRNNDIFDEQKLFYSAATQNPTYPNGPNASGGWDCNINATQINNPLALIVEEDKDKVLNFNSHIKLNYRIGKDWNVTAFGSYSFVSSENSQFKPTWIWAHGQADRSETKSEAWLGNIAVNWTHDWGVHHLAAKQMAEYQSHTTTAFNATVRGLSHNTVTNNNLAAGSMRQYGATGSSYMNDALLSFLTQVDYRLMDKYTVTVNARVDGSSMFADDHKWGLFPSLSATWDLRKESFFDDFDWLSQLKLRAGMGISGNLGGITAYNTLALLYPTGLVPWYGTATVTYTPKTNPNPDLHWETAKKTDIAVDFGFLGGLITGSFDYFSEKRSDILINGADRAVPSYFGGDAPVANLGKVKSSGYELDLRFNKQLTHDLRLWGNVAFTHATNKIEERDDPQLTPEYQKRAGKTIDQTYTYVNKGSYNNWDELYGSTAHDAYDENRLPGNYIILDYDADGVITTNDNIPYGFSGIPQNTVNFQIGVDWKGWSAFVQFYGTNNVTRYVSLQSLADARTSGYHEGSYWTPENQNGMPLPRWSSNVKASDYTNGTRFLFDGSYLRLKYAEISYTFSKEKWLKSVGLQSLKLFVNGNNLALWTDMPDDRESNTGGWSAYPTARRFNFGLKVTL